MNKELTEEEKKHYLNILIENKLFNKIKSIRSNQLGKEEKINELIEHFYEEYKEYYGISCIEEIIAKIEELKTAEYILQHSDGEER